MFILQEKPIDLTHARHIYSNPTSGALVSFEGVVRRDKHKDTEVSSLLYIADTAACTQEGEKIITDAQALFQILNATCIQRIGQVNATETAIWIGVWSTHRDEAFKGCRFIIEETKKRLLIWKKEFYTNGSCAWIRGAQTPSIL